MTTRIIVADDEAHITRAVTMKLSKVGFDVEAVHDGQAALDAAQRETPAMVITDFQMPRMDGLSLCRNLRDCPETQEIPIILLTAKGFELDEQTLAEELRITRLVVKPFSPR
jgi:two-component system, OmpR family, alkaline phosphatase synthesis response regulator PhoP